MDPVAHTLVGAALAESGLRRRSPLATATLVLGANAPDIDIVSAFGGSDASLALRRGHTHGVLAMVVLPLLLTGIMLGWDRWVRRPEAERARPLVIVALSTLAVWTHPVLDWMNTYGVRLLMPFDDRWFYGDALFIIDPWLWLLMAAPVVLACSRGKLSAAAWIVLACATSALVLAVGAVPWPAKAVWLIGVTAIVGLRLARPRAPVAPIAGGCLAVLAAYLGAMVLGSRVARDEAAGWLAERGIVAQAVAAGPQPADPFARTVIARAGDSYHFLERRFVGEPAWRLTREPLAAGPRDEVVAAALAAPSVRGLSGWLRFPVVAVDRSGDGYRVTIRDARYLDNPGGLGHAVVELDADLRPR